MINIIKSLILIVVISCAATSSYAEGDLNVALPGHGVLSFAVPPGWIAKTQRPREDLPPTIVFSPDHGSGFQILVTPIWPANSSIPPITEEALKKQVGSAAERVKSQSVEKELPLVPFNAPGVFGAYFSATDKSPEPNGYQHMTQGMLSLRELGITFTILTNGETTKTTDDALQMLKSLHISPDKSERNDAIQIKAREHDFEITVPVSKLTLLLPSQGLSQFAGSSTSNRYFLFNDGVRNITISGWFEPAARFTGAKNIWDKDLGARTGSPFGPTDVSFTKIGNWDVISYSIRVPENSSSNTNFRAHWIQADTWIELHLSTSANSSPSERYSTLSKVLQSIEIQERR